MTRTVTRSLVLGFMVLALSAASFAQVFVSVRIGPPALPIYAQPICPGPGYFWTPGYWGWNDDGGYYWVPGTWVVAPIGMLWTPGYWGWGGGFYAWHAGYWGPHIGFYGGINYGFGYGGVGFVGGEWRGGAFFYNRAVTNVSVTNVTNVYNHTVVVNENHVAFNGGQGGVAARPTAAEEAASHEQHMAPIAAQIQHQQLASQNRQNFASENHGRPAIAATSRAGDFSSHSAVAARSAGAEYHAPAMSPKEARASSPAGSKSNDGFRSFMPPSKTESNNSRTTNNSEPSRNTQSHTESSPHSAPASHNEPKPNQHSNPAPHKSSPPPHQSAPKEPRKGR
ncbi:MAG: hypothetical protein WAN03_03905 [Candidatus Sulfotelmatobacter sp.]